MEIVPLTLRQANDLVLSLHRHHEPVRGHRFSLGLLDGERLVGAVIVGRPVARNVDWRNVCEVTRLVTDGTPNACSALYGAAARVAREMGFAKVQTYILAPEPGTSLRASGWVLEAGTEGGDWNRPSRGGRRRDQPSGRKQRWSKTLREGGTVTAIAEIRYGCPGCGTAIRRKRADARYCSSACRQAAYRARLRFFGLL